MVTAVGHQNSGAQIPNKKKIKKYMKIKIEEKEGGKRERQYSVIQPF